MTVVQAQKALDELQAGQIELEDRIGTLRGLLKTADPDALVDISAELAASNRALAAYPGRILGAQQALADERQKANAPKIAKLRKQEEKTWLKIEGLLLGEVRKSTESLVELHNDLWALGAGAMHGARNLGALLDELRIARCKRIDDFADYPYG